MLIVLLFVGGFQEKHKPKNHLAEWYLNKWHSLHLSHPVLFWLGGGTGNGPTNSLGHNGS